MRDATSAASQIAPARRRGLADEAADRIREAIFDGVYPPGAPLREVELAAALDVSRGPVREALLRLEREGLVRTAWHRGATVTELSPDDVAEIYSLRAALEQLAVERVVAGAPDDEIDAIAVAAERMAHATSEIELVHRDIEFHDTVYAAAHHRRLEEAWQAIRSQVHLSLLTRLGVSREGYLADIPAEHLELVAALRARDHDAALDQFAQHREHAFKLLTHSEEVRRSVPR
jgi:DNA-binding GntR family transcriptional regulator